MLKCCYFEVSELAQQEVFDRAMGELAWSERVEKVGKYRFDKDKMLCLGAGLLAADMLRKAGASDLRLGYSEHGKPYLAHHKDIHFNLSHDGTLAVCAVSGEAVGADVQKLTQYSPKIASRVFSPEETALIESSADRDEVFTRLWVRKESCIKLLGKGFACNTKTLSVLDGGEFFFSEHRAGDYLICVCSASEHKAGFSQWKYSE